MSLTRLFIYGVDGYVTVDNSEHDYGLRVHGRFIEKYALVAYYGAPKGTSKLIPENVLK